MLQRLKINRKCLHFLFAWILGLSRIDQGIKHFPKSPPHKISLQVGFLLFLANFTTPLGAVSAICGVIALNCFNCLTPEGLWFEKCREAKQKEEGRRKKEEGRRKKEEGRRKEVL